MNKYPATRFEHLKNGFTLVELVIVVAIVAVLAAIAYPSYRDHVIKTRRADAKATLTEAAARLEQYYAENKGYPTTNDMTLLGLPEYPAGSKKTKSPDGYYLVNFAATPTATSYTLQAVPQGDQANDKKCKTFTLTNTGQRGVTGSPAPTQSAADCWK